MLAVVLNLKHYQQKKKSVLTLAQIAIRFIQGNNALPKLMVVLINLIKNTDLSKLITEKLLNQMAVFSNIRGTL